MYVGIDDTVTQEYSLKCPECSGTKVILINKGTKKDPVIESEPCPRCHDTGEFDLVEPKTVFVLGLFDNEIGSKIKLMSAQHEAERVKVGEVDYTDLVFETLRHGLKDIKNGKWPFKTEEINVPRLGKRTVASKETLRHIGIDECWELYNELIKLNFLQKQELKN